MRHVWGAYRVSYAGPNGQTRTLPTEWTDLASVDLFVTMANGRVPFRLVDLLALRAMVPRVNEDSPEEEEE